MATIYFEPRLVLADGQILEGSSCGYSEKHVWCFLKDMTIGDAFRAFSNPEKTSEIHHFYGTMEEIYYGFNEVTSVIKRELTTDIKLEGGNVSRVIIDHSKDPEPGN